MLANYLSKFHPSNSPVRYTAQQVTQSQFLSTYLRKIGVENEFSKLHEDSQQAKPTYFEKLLIPFQVNVISSVAIIFDEKCSLLCIHRLIKLRFDAPDLDFLIISQHLL